MLCYREKNAENNFPKDLFFTRHSLVFHLQEKEKSLKPNSRSGNYVYCDDEKHVSSRCNVITNVEARKNLGKSQSRCFIYLSKGHVSKTCIANYSCGKCKNRHHVSVC